jgi:heme-degrading monooxygenase HmoA
MYVIIWEYRVRSGSEAAFEQAYGREGDWVRLFEQGQGYRGTELHRDLAGGRRYVTIDRWTSRAAYDALHDRNLAEYAAIDRRFKSLTEHEALVGTFEGVSAVPAPIVERPSGDRPRRAKD